MNDIRKVLSYNDVLLCPRHSELDHLSDADVKFHYELLDGMSFSAVPVVNAPMNTVCSTKLLNVLHNGYLMPVTIHRWFDSAEDQIKFFKECNFDYPMSNVFFAVGNKSKWMKWIDTLINYSLDSCHPIAFLVDVANGDTKQTMETIKYIKSSCDASVMAGNIATRSSFERLQGAGANFIRVGIGGGSICSTRTNTGFGIPTLTSVMDCAKSKDNAYLVADGGVEYTGDILKAMAAGADMVMAGKMFAATDLSGGKKIYEGHEIPHYYSGKGEEIEKEWAKKPRKILQCQYSGMASKEAIQSLNSHKTHTSIEGVSGYIPYQGTTDEVVGNMVGNLRSAMAYYAGCKDWKSFRRRVKLLEISQQGWEESKTRIL